MVGMNEQAGAQPGSGTVVGDQEIDVTHDDLIGEIGRMIHDEGVRASDAGESAAKTADFNERTGMNNQGLSWLKSIIKKLAKKDGERKAMDVVRTLKVGLPMIEDHIKGQQPDLPMEDPEAGDAEPEGMSDPVPDGVEDNVVSAFEA